MLFSICESFTWKQRELEHIAVSSFGGYSYLYCWEGFQERVRRWQHGTKKMSDEDLKKLSSFEYKAAEKGSSPVECVVSLENFRKGDKCKLLPNSFYSQRIDPHLSNLSNFR
ncbi:uncharacterized protein LOC111317208 [Durio zibethinus]|uniref:Uncharacterized protein LOC111317208 n=1 Tax=Durio zibethinus TaxID=66656 RepID=A0A6P6BE10_DURZI|nr:uncharacterized protein LOC111317208 [Durio zibethinus]